MKTYHKLNFHKHTYCEFKFVELAFFEEKAIHFTSKSGSKYFYADEGVYRYSNHWGRVANCRWKIKEINDYKNQNYYVGFANWSEFFPLNSNEKAFYLEVTSNGGCTIVYNENKNSSNYLMNLNVAFKRQKEIKSLFKNDKWAKYYNEDINELRRKLINGLITSNKSLQVLKTELNV